MPRVTYNTVGEVIVYDGDNAAEIATACKVDPVPAPDDDGAITLEVPLPNGGSAETTLAPGDGLVVREVMGGFLPITADQLEEFGVAA